MMEVSYQGVIQQFLLPSSTSNGFFVLHKYPAEGRIQNLPFIVLLKCSRKLHIRATCKATVFFEFLVQN